MAYVPPTYDASGRTWTQLKANGLHGHTFGVLGAQSTTAPTPAVAQQLGLIFASNASLPVARAKALVDAYLSGRGNQAAIKAALFDLQQAFGVLASSIGEIATLIDAN